VREVNALVDNFRETAAALGLSYKELDSANQSLEHKVVERTQELSEANRELAREIAAREQYQRTLAEHAAILEKTADALRMKEQEQSTLLANLPDIVWMRDAESRYVFVNRAFELAVGLSADEIISRAGELMVAEGEALGCKLDDRLAKDSRQTLVKEKQLTLGDGKTRIYSTTRTPLFDDFGVFQGMIGVFHDITERRQAEEALRQQFELYQAVVRAQSDVGEGLLIIEEGRIVFVNDALCRISGYSTLEVLARRNFLDLVHEEDRERVGENYRRRLAGESVEERYEIGIVTRDGERREAEIAVATLGSGDSLRVVVVVSDITARKRTEESVLQGHRLLDAINAALSQYVSDTDPRALFDNLLADFLSFTGSEYGLIGEVLNDHEGQPFVRVHALTDISWDDASRALFEKFKRGQLEFHRRGTLLGEVLLTGQPVIANDAGRDPRSGGLPPGHPAMDAFMGLPLYSGDDFVGMVAVANRPGGYDQSLVDYLQPLLRTLARLVEAYRATTRRKLDQQALAHTLAELEAQKFALDQHSIVSIADAAGRITYVNDKFTEISQYAREELLGQDHRLLNSGHHSTQFWEEMWSTIALGKVWSGIIRNRSKDGGFYWVDSTIVPFLDANGVPYQYVSIRTDFTERKRDEDALTQLNRVLKTLSACSEALVHITDESELLDEVCRVIVEVGGYRMAWVGLGENDAAKRVRPVAQAGFEDGYLEAVRVSWAEGERGMGPGGIAIRTRMPCTVQDIANDPMFEPWREEAQRRGYASVIALPLFLDDAAIAMLAVFSPRAGAFGTDEAQLLSELAGDLEYGIKALRVRAQNALVLEELRQSEERLARVFNLSPDPVSIRRISDGVYLAVNDAFCRAFGRPREEVIGHNALELGVWVDRDEYQTMAHGIAEHGRVQGHEIRLRSGSGEVRWAVLSAAALDYEGEPCILAVSHDITERKRMGLELLEAKDVAEQASHAKSEFLSRMSHELRTPLNAILGFAQLMNTDPEAPLAPRQQEDMQHILKAGWHLLGLINDVLDLARVESGKLQLNMASLDLSVVVRECSGLISPLAAKRGVRVIDSAAANEAHWVEADHMRVKQVLLNLMSNAVKFNSEQGSVTLSYQRTDDGMLRISVVDTGPGIAPELQNQLFEPFARLDADKKGIDGTGIGLAIAKRMVELMGGRIGVQSEPGQGSEFWIELRVAQSRPA
jgi:PAS domain S-box-containing protein